jgi:SM-20-related protein
MKIKNISNIEPAVAHAAGPTYPTPPQSTPIKKENKIKPNPGASAPPYQTLIDTIHKNGWSSHDIFLPEALTIELAAQCAALKISGALTPAQVGRGTRQAAQPEIRTDQIQWLTAGQSPACDQYLAIMETLRIALNRSLYLGLDAYESHFACFEPGAFYLQHLDRFRDNDARTVSVVVYLNANWLPEHGGALRLHPAGLCTQDVAPCASRLVMFLSADMRHEVLPATRDRLSLAGWFTRRN